MVKAKVYIFERQFDGAPKEGDLKLIEEELPPIKDGEFLAEAVYLSVDPYMRAYSPMIPLGSVFIGAQVAKVTESKHPTYPVGKYVVADYGWRSHTISDGTSNTKLLLDFQGLPLSLGLGALGMPGNTAYFGFLQICKPKAGETVVVTAGAGAVGSLVGQIAKIKGAKAIGITGSDDKGRWLVDELGFDHYINYKTQNVEEELRRVAPQGVDCYFDNIAGEISSIVLKQMNSFGRIALSGATAGYNDRTITASIVQYAMASKQLRMEGFLVWRWNDQWDEGILQILRWIKEGKIKYRETVTEGFENMFEAFCDLLKGGNFGKAVVKV